MTCDQFLPNIIGAQLFHHFARHITPIEIKSKTTEPTIVIEDKSSTKPAYEKPTQSKDFYVERLEVLEKELAEAEKDLKDNNKEYLPLVRIKNSYERNYQKHRI